MKNMKKQKVRVLVNNLQKKINIKVKDIRNIGTKMLLYLKCDSSELSITIVTDKQMKKMNLEYRGKNYSTDVLSFPQDMKYRKLNKVLVLGDVIISAETALKQALLNNQDFMDEIKLLLAHGILHLLGYDHIKNHDNRVMQKMEKKIKNYV